jgi:hypothetical protein
VPRMLESMKDLLSSDDWKRALIALKLTFMNNGLKSERKDGRLDAMR